MPKDYYIVLGVNREANLPKIKQAYRKIVKQYHPDISKEDETSERFCEITDAYETLSDSHKRKIYDRMLSEREARVRIPPTLQIMRKRKSHIDVIGSHFSFIDDFFEGFVPGLLIEKSIKSFNKDLYIEMILSPDEARKGGIFPLSVPVLELCSHCKKIDSWEKLFCPVCSGSGVVRSEREFSLGMPPNISNGTRIRISLEDIGLENVYLNLFINIAPSYESQCY